MPAATQLLTSFLGGEISPYAQGRYDRPDYRTSMRTCLNSFPIEIGAWARRPGTRHGGHTRGGAAGRTMKFDFEQSSSVTMEFTDGKLRFRSGAVLITTNDAVAITSISTANPAVVQVASAVTWATGDTVLTPGASTPLLENRQFIITVIDSTHFSIKDALTGAGIDGSTLGALAIGATVQRVHELSTIYLGSSWQNIRTVQAETTDLLLCPNLKPQMLTVQTLPSTGINPQFSIADIVFNDGPYLDPFTNGAEVTPDASSGIVTLTVTFPAYSATTAYAKGSFVTSSSVNYVSLVDQNVGNTPVSSPSSWQATTASAAINDGRGFLGSDVGRLVRLLSEPPYWNSSHSYSSGDVVSYNPSGVAGATTYWQAAAGNTGHAPGTDLTNWTLVAQGAAIWTWGKIIALSNIIDRQLAGSVTIGSMSGSSAAFDGVFSKVWSSSAVQSVSGGSFSGSITLDGYVGKNYSGASAQKIQQVTVYPTSDVGWGRGSYNNGGADQSFAISFSLRLRAKNSAPSSPSDGVLLGSASFSANNSTITIPSNDQSTTWNYVWVELVASTDPSLHGLSYSLITGIAQMSFYSPTTSSSASTGCKIELLGPSLIYSGQVITTWRLGAYSDTTGWPTCGTYHEGRIWLAGAIKNRFDASVSNGISGNNINFSPTDQYGAVAASNAMSEVLNSDGVNPIFWMKPDLQGVVFGTQQGEWLALAPTNGPMSPTNIAARRMTKHGSENVEPARAEHANLFVKRHGRKLLEYFADAYSGKFSAPNLADRASHLISAGITELAYTEAVNPIVWGRDGNNALFGMTYRRTVISTSQGPDFYGWHRHELGSGRTVESICAGPSVGGDLDTLTMVTAGATGDPRHVEVMTDAAGENDAFADAWFLDDAVNPTSITTTVAPSTGAPFGGMTVNGLWHLNGKTVQVFAGGLDCGDRGDLNVITDFVVTNGSCFVPFGDSVSAGPGKGLFTLSFLHSISLTQIVVGFTYDSDGQAVRLVAQADTGARNGPALGAPSRSHRAALKLVNTTGLSMGGNFARLYPCELKAGTDNASVLPTLSLFSGIFYDQNHDDFTYDDSLCWRVSRPYPATITAAGVNLRTEDM